MNARHPDDTQGLGTQVSNGCLSARGSADRDPQVDHPKIAVLPTKAPPLKQQQMDGNLESWFVSVILPHEAALTGFLRRFCKSSSDVPDLRQETYIRVCESAARSRPRFPKAFLFATARNLVIDRLRRERVVPVDHVPNGIPLNLSIDELTPERQVAAREDLQQLNRAFASLPQRTKSVIWLRRISGLSQREAAASLGIDEGALEGHMTRGMRRLAQALIPNGTQRKDWLSELQC